MTILKFVDSKQIFFYWLSLNTRKHSKKKEQNKYLKYVKSLKNMFILENFVEIYIIVPIKPDVLLLVSIF